MSFSPLRVLLWIIGTGVEMVKQWFLGMFGVYEDYMWTTPVLGAERGLPVAGLKS